MEVMSRAPILYKYLDVTGAKAFLERPQLRHTAFHGLDDICDSFPAFSHLTADRSRQEAVEKAARKPVKGISFHKQIKFYERLGMVSPSYLETTMRELISQGHGYSAFICSLVARTDSLAMWHQYGDKHGGIVFGIGSDLHRVIGGKGRFLEKVDYPESNERPNTPFNNPKPAEIAHIFSTKGQDWSYQQEWRIISDNPETDLLDAGEVKEVIFGCRYSGDKGEVMHNPIFKDTKFFDAYPDPKYYRMASLPLNSGE